MEFLDFEQSMRSSSFIFGAWLSNHETLSTQSYDSLEFFIYMLGTFTLLMGDHLGITCPVKKENKILIYTKHVFFLSFLKNNNKKHQRDLIFIIGFKNTCTLHVNYWTSIFCTSIISTNSTFLLYISFSKGENGVYLLDFFKVFCDGF